MSNKLYYRCIFLVLSFLPAYIVTKCYLFDVSLVDLASFYSNTKKTQASKNSCDAELFTDYKRFRRAILDTLIVFDNEDLSANYKNYYLELCVNFLPTLIRGKSLEKIGNTVQVEMKQIVNMTEKKTTVDKHQVLTILGKLFRKMRLKFEAEFKHCIDKCYFDLDTAKKTILSNLEEIQRGSICKNSKIFYQVQKDANMAGMGSILHRLIVCFTVALQTNVPCRFDDSKFHYGSGELKKMFRNLETCDQVKNNSNKIDFFSLGPDVLTAKYGKFTFPGVPKKYVSDFYYCHEDISAWYTGVLLLFLTAPTDYMRINYQNFENEYLKKLNADFFGIHIRSTDKVAETRKLRNSKQFLNLVGSWLQFEDTKFQDMWIASDNRTYYETIKKTFSESEVNSLNQTSSVKSTRYKTESLHQFLFDLYALRKSSVVFGSFCSHMMILLYELRSVDDIFPSDHIFSLDMYYYHSPVRYYNHVFITNSDNLYFKTRPSKSIPRTVQSDCFSPNGNKLDHVTNYTVILPKDLKAPADGFHLFSYFEDKGVNQNNRKVVKSCFAPLFALDRVQLLV